MTEEIRNETCPVEAASRLLGARWTLQIIHHLRTPKRFCELQELVGDPNPTTLTKRLKYLEKEEILRRIPLTPHDHIAEYQLTQIGQGLLPIIDELSGWSEQWMGRTNHL